MSIVDIRTVSLSSKGQIVLPVALREGLGLKPGEKIVVISYKDHIELKPLKSVSKALETMIASERVLAKDWNSKEEDEAWKDL